MHRGSTAGILLALLVLAAASPAPGDEEATEAIVPEWCRCESIAATADPERKAELIREAERQQAQCREALGVSMQHQRKGQGARLDACHCPCLAGDAETKDGPWGDRNKPAGRQQGKGPDRTEPDDPQDPARKQEEAS
jgi:hypothetical protein